MLPAWPDAVTCPTCDRRFTPSGIDRHVCHGVPATRTPWRTCEHCGGRFTSKGLSRHESACARPKPTHDCESCDATFPTPRMLSLHRGKAHPQGEPIDPRLASLRAIAAGRGWLVVADDDPDCVLAVRVADPITVVHARTDGGEIVGRVVSRARGPEQFGALDADAPIALTLAVAGFDDLRAVLERLS